MKKMTDSMTKGWEAWVAQVAELHIFHANQENRRKEEGKGFYKLNEESVTPPHSGGASEWLLLPGPNPLHGSVEVIRRIRGEPS